MMINHSPIVLGTMRLADKSLAANNCVNLFQHAMEQGVTSFHISSEYSSFELVCNGLKQLSRVQKAYPRIVAKLAAPHFSDTNFESLLLEQRVDELLLSTGYEQIDTAQWMWRHNPLDDSVRIPELIDKSELIKESFKALVKKGKVGEFACFPYTAEFMKTTKRLGIAEKHINYLNFWEDDLIDGGLSNGALALRPFYAGKHKELSQNTIALFNQIAHGDAVFHCLNYVLSHAYVQSAVVGINSIEQLDAIVSRSEKIQKDPVIFNEYRKVIIEARQQNDLFITK